jgi:hypothetical protein
MALRKLIKVDYYKNSQYSDCFLAYPYIKSDSIISIKLEL